MADDEAPDAPPPPRYSFDPLNIAGRRNKSKWDDALEILGWLNPLTLVTAIATGIAEVVGRLFSRKRG